MVNEQQCSIQMDMVMETIYKNGCSTMQEQVGRSMSTEQHCSTQTDLVTTVLWYNVSL